MKRKDKQFKKYRWIQLKCQFFLFFDSTCSINKQTRQKYDKIKKHIYVLSVYVHNKRFELTVSRRAELRGGDVMVM